MKLKKKVKPPTAPVENPVTKTAAPSVIWWKHPQVIGWMIAACFALGLIVLLWSDDDSTAPAAGRPAENALKAAPNPAPENPPPQSAPKRTQQSSEPKQDPEPSQKENAQQEPANDTASQAQQQLENLGRHLLVQLNEVGHFPPGIVGDGEPQTAFGWQAKLVTRLQPADGLTPQWELGWQDPENARFVRQRIPQLLNPAIRQLSGEHRFPATHFAGMAGVGADAPQLPVDHPRSGIFGDRRFTRLQDIKDGAAETILLSGVQKDLGPWAAAGAATVRPLVTKPYINGPDGFGTGQRDGMWVLMADGGTRFLAADTDPQLLESLAAMSDQFYQKQPPQKLVVDSPPPAPPNPIQETVPETGQKPKPHNSFADLAQLVKEGGERASKDQPNDIPTPKILNQEEVETRLKQSIKQIKVDEPIGFGPLLMDLEELAGVPFEYDRKAFQQKGGLWDRQVRLNLKEVTVQQVLKDLLEIGDLESRIVNGKVVIETKRTDVSTATPPKDLIKKRE